MKQAVILLLVIAGGMSALTGENMEDPRNSLASLLPAQVAGWKAVGEDQLFDPETIFDYIDGAGEVYRSYNFRQLLSRRYSREGAADLVADLFDMGSSGDAFGVFTHDLEGTDAAVGQGSSYKGGLLSFWRDRYFVSLTAEAETEESKEALLALGRDVSARIGRDGEKPELLRFLPEDFRLPRAVHYFHTYPVLNYHFFVAAENILNLGPETEAALSVKAGASGGEYLVLIRYPGEADAAKAFSGFTRAYMPEAGAEALVRTEDGKWTGAAKQGKFMVLIFQAASAEEARATLRLVSLGLERS